jgi:hypothetical protein
MRILRICGLLALFAAGSAWAASDTNVLYEEHFDTDVIESGDWTRSDASVYVDTAQGVLHIAPDGYHSDSAVLALEFSLPVEIETRQRLISGGRGYTLPTFTIHWDSGLAETVYLPDSSDGWGWKFLAAGWTQVDTMGPTSENQWRTIKQVIYPDSGSLWVKTDSDTTFSLVVTSDWSIPKQLQALSFEQPWDAVCDLDYVKVTSLSVTDSLIIPSIAQLPCDDECLVQPIQVLASQEIGGVTIPIEIPEGVTVCDVTTDGLATADWHIQEIHVNSDSGFVTIGLADPADVLPLGITTVCNIHYYAPPLCEEDQYFQWDTTLMEDFSRQLKFTNAGGTVVINPGFDAQRDSAGVLGYTAGDINGDGTDPDIADLICLVTHMFQGDTTCVCVAATMNVNGIGELENADIADLVYLVTYMFQGGPDLLCPGDGGVGKIVQDNAVGFTRTYAEGVTTFSLNSPYDLLGVQLELAGVGNGNPVSMLSNDIELIFGREGDRIKLGLLDMEGESVIGAGNSVLFEIDGEWEIVSALAADRSFNTIIPTLTAKTESTVLPASFALGQNYPNPFNPSTEISFSLPAASDVTLSVYNMLGQTVAVLADEHMSAGHHTVTWDGSQVASGVYFYKLSTSEFTDTKKMMLLK